MTETGYIQGQYDNLPIVDVNLNVIVFKNNNTDYIGASNY